MACCAACLMASGALKSGKPCARLTALYSIARRVISRITDSVNWEVRLLRNRGRRFSIGVGRTRVFSAKGVIRRVCHTQAAVGRTALLFQSGLPEHFQKLLLGTHVDCVRHQLAVAAVNKALGNASDPEQLVHLS